jgi:lycopene cyclase domain-containing protein
MTLYFQLLFFSVFVPAVLSFDKKLQFWRQWKHLFPAMIPVAALYIISDIYLTQAGVWGFNPEYHSQAVIFGLPLEEWLFFIVIPYASIFLHETFALYFPWLKVNSTAARWITILLLFLLLLVVVFNWQKAYTLYMSVKLIVVLLLAAFDRSREINRYFVTFLVITIPFLIVNSILTGSFIENEVVWYNNSENLGVRVFTIPVEDFGYAFSMILFTLLLRNKLRSLWMRKSGNL